MTCRAPVSRLDALFDRWPASEVIHVIHDTAYAPENFNPGSDAAGVLRKPTRFAPIRDAKGQVVSYLYGGSTLDCAIFETVFHDVPIDAPDKFVDLDFFAQRGHGKVVPSRDLRLVDLTSEGLHRLKVPKEELITSPSRDWNTVLADALADATADLQKRVKEKVVKEKVVKEKVVKEKKGKVVTEVAEVVEVAEVDRRAHV